MAKRADIAFTAPQERALGLYTVLGDVIALAGMRCRVLRGVAVQYDLLVDGPHDTFSEARPLTAFPEAKAVAPTGTCTAIYFNNMDGRR